MLFEPDSETFSLLQKNLRINGLDCAVPFRAAVSDESGTGKLKVTGKYSGTTRLACATDDSSSDDLRHVDLVTIDDTLNGMGIREISFMKIDTEGHELQVLRGAIRTL